MNDQDPTHDLKQMIRDLSIQVSELKLQLQRMEDIQTHRHALLYEWCAPATYKVMVDHASVPTDIPDDLKQFFPER